MKSYFHSALKGLLCLGLIVAIHHLPLMAQEDKGSTKLIIIKEHIDADGNKTVERIEKEGLEAEQFDLENFSNGGEGLNPQIEWKSFNFGDENSPFQNFEFDGQMPNLEQFFGGFFGDQNGMEGFRSFSPFGDIDKPRLGVQIQAMESQEGVLISSVQPGSVAEEVGLKTGDIILAVDGVEIAEPDQLAEIIRSHEFGDKLSLDLLRDSKHLVMEAQLGTAREKEIKSRKI